MSPELAKVIARIVLYNGLKLSLLYAFSRACRKAVEEQAKTDPYAKEMLERLEAR